MPGMGMAMSGPAKVTNGIVGTIGAKRGLDAGILAGMRRIIRSVIVLRGIIGSSMQMLLDRWLGYL